MKKMKFRESDFFHRVIFDPTRLLYLIYTQTNEKKRKLELLENTEDDRECLEVEPKSFSVPPH